MAVLPATPPTEPGIHYVGPENRVTWVEPPYDLRKYELLREKFSVIKKGIDPDEHAVQQTEKRKRQAAEEGDDEDSDGGNAPPFKRVHRTRSIQKRKQTERAQRPLVKKHHEYIPDYRFYLKGGDVYFVIERIIFCVHRRKLTTSGGYLNDMLDRDLVYHEETIRRRPVLALDTLGITVRQFRFFLAYTYRIIMIHQKLPSGKSLLYFEAALEVLAASVRLDHQGARQAALEGLEALFPTTGTPVAFKPAIAGLRNKEEEENFYRTFPLQAIPVLEEYRAPAMLPIAYYHAAQLSCDDLLNGVTVGDKLIKLDASYAEIALKGRDALKVARNTLLFKWLHDLVEGEQRLGPRKATLKCLDRNLRGNLACFPFLERLLGQSNKNLYIHGTNSLEGFTDTAKEIISEHLCVRCLEHVLTQAARCLAASWRDLPVCFGLAPWEELQKLQKSYAEGFAGIYT